MIDEPQIGKPDKVLALKCECCGFYFDYDEDRENWQRVDETGMCCECPI